MVPHSCPLPYVCSLQPLEVERRKTGMDWTYLGETMTGMARLDNVEALVNDVLARKVPGDYIETGVWR